MTTEPNSAELQIPTGYATFLKDGDSGPARDLGNISSFTISNEITKKDKFKNRGGRRTKWKTFTTQVGATAKFTLDQISADNIQYFALGNKEENSDGTITIDGLTETDFSGTLKVIGDNEAGPQLDWEGKVQFTPSGDFTFIKDNDDTNVIQIEASVQDDGSFPPGGRWTWRAQA